MERDGLDATVEPDTAGRLDATARLGRREALGRFAALLMTHGGPALGAGSTPAGKGPAPSRGFDFLHGRWDVIHRKLRRRLAESSDWSTFPGTLEVSPILDGLGNFDVNRIADPDGAYEAHSLRLFTPGTGGWSIWWFDSRFPALDPPVVGGFAGPKATFHSDDSFAGRRIRVRTTYEPRDANRAEWTQAFSPDGGATWEVNWIMDFRRAA